MEVELTGKISFVLREAMRQAKLSNEKMRHGAVVFKGGKIITSAPNKSGYSNYSSRFRAFTVNSTHAECNCLEKLDKTGCDILVIRLDKYNKLANSKPCEMCNNACFYAGIRYIYYSNEFGSINRVKPGKGKTYKLDLDTSNSRFNRYVY